MDRSIHLCFKTVRAGLLAHGSSVMCPLSSGICPAVVKTAVEICNLTVRTSPLRGIAPSRQCVGLALVQSYCVRLLAHHRPHVSISEALPSALASCGIPPDTPCGWHLLTTTRESTCQVISFPGSIGRTLRVTLSTGFHGGAYWSVG